MILTTERLVLREFTVDDWPAVLAYQSDPRYLRYYPPTHTTVDDARAFVRRLVEWQREQPRRRYQMAVVLAAEGRLIGNCGIRMAAPEAPGDTFFRADMGYEIAPTHWGQGYATEAARAMLAYGFERLNLYRVWAQCVADNLASARVLEKLGMRLEGRLRDNEQFKGRRWDTLLYAILEPEWRAKWAGHSARVTGIEKK
jgi:RimJ/RimL family protein N-acetyltransferase